jgi:hypothetical protein
MTDTATGVTKVHCIQSFCQHRFRGPEILALYMAASGGDLRLQDGRRLVVGSRQLGRGLREYPVLLGLFGPRPQRQVT